MVFYVEAGVIVVIKFFCGDAIAGEDERGVDGAGGGEAEGDVILIECDIPSNIGVGENEGIFAVEFGAGGDSEGFEVAFFAGRFEAEAFVTISDDVLGADQAFGALAATFHLGLGESFDVVEIAISIGWSDGCGWCGAE